jgi:[ribosomal protein S18]-alanine N-acetyltransferase
MSPVTLRLRQYMPDDFETLYEIDQVCYAPAIAYSRRDLRSYLRLPGAECVVAETSAGIVAFCITARDAAEGHIITLDVIQACRRHGAGSLLLAEAERRLAASGVGKVSLETATDNSAAIAFWQKHGYRTLSVLKRYYPNGLDAWAMSKTIGMSSKPVQNGGAL